MIALFKLIDSMISHTYIALAVSISYREKGKGKRSHKTKNDKESNC